MATTHSFESQKHIFLNIKKTNWIGFGREKKKSFVKQKRYSRQFGLFAQLVWLFAHKGNWAERYITLIRSTTPWNKKEGKH